MDTPVGRATKASQWRYSYPPDPTDEQRATVVVSRLGFKAGAAWSRTDALTDPTDTEIAGVAEATFVGAFADIGEAVPAAWADLDPIDRAQWVTIARLALSSFLTGRRAEG